MHIGMYTFNVLVPVFQFYEKFTYRYIYVKHMHTGMQSIPVQSIHTGMHILYNLDTGMYIYKVYIPVPIC